MILCFGSNFFGQLGLGSQSSRQFSSVPVPFASLDGSSGISPDEVKDIQCGAQFSVILKKSGNLSICGALNGVVSSVLTPVEIMYPLRCTQIACGRKHILARVCFSFTPYLTDICNEHHEPTNTFQQILWSFKCMQIFLVLRKRTRLQKSGPSLHQSY